jgi:quinol monooxygenase YgiN
MIYKTAEYKVKKDALPEALTAIRDFVESVKDEKGTLLYDAYCKKDEVSFVHFMAFKNKEAEEAHRSTEHVKRFVEILYPNCEEEPVFTDVTKIASTQNE